VQKIVIFLIPTMVQIVQLLFLPKKKRIMLFTQTVSLIHKVNVENTPAQVNLRSVS